MCRRRAWGALVLLLVGLTALGCIPQIRPALSGTAWRAVQIWDDTQGSLRPVDGRAPTLTFRTDDEVGGTGGCNTFRGGYKADSQHLTFTSVASTEMYCYPPGAPPTGQSAQMLQETAFFKALNAVDGYRYDGPRLVLTTGGNATLVFEPA